MPLPEPTIRLFRRKMSWPDSTRHRRRVVRVAVARASVVGEGVVGVRAAQLQALDVHPARVAPRRARAADLDQRARLVPVVERPARHRVLARDDGPSPAIRHPRDHDGRLGRALRADDPLRAVGHGAPVDAHEGVGSEGLPRRVLDLGVGLARADVPDRGEVGRVPDLTADVSARRRRSGVGDRRGRSGVGGDLRVARTAVRTGLAVAARDGEGEGEGKGDRRAHASTVRGRPRSGKAGPVHGRERRRRLERHPRMRSVPGGARASTPESRNQGCLQRTPSQMRSVPGGVRASTPESRD
jgi:hypothetical protein